MKLVLATHNKGKAREFEQILSEFFPQINLLSLDTLGIPGPLEEHGTTLEENAIQKAIWVYKRTGIPSLSDDSGLEVDALGGAPGVFSARFAGPEAKANENNQKLLECLASISDRRARFKTVLCLAGPFGCRTWEGTLEGKIAPELRGSMGFGYDPIFIPNNDVRCLAELNEKEKNRISHRREALAKLAKHLVEEFR